VVDEKRVREDRKQQRSVGDGGTRETKKGKGASPPCDIGVHCQKNSQPSRKPSKGRRAREEKSRIAGGGAMRTERGVQSGGPQDPDRRKGPYHMVKGGDDPCVVKKETRRRPLESLKKSPNGESESPPHRERKNDQKYSTTLTSAGIPIEVISKLKGKGQGF